MFHHGVRHISASGLAALMLGIALPAVPSTVLAQRGGGGGGGGGGAGAGAGGGRNPIICVHDCPALREGLSEKDDLKDFHRVMAVQATAEQRAAFARIAQYAQAAIDRLQTFRKSLPEIPAPAPLSDRATALDRAIEEARAGCQNFLASFSSAQKSGLQDVARKLAKADSDLDKEVKTLDQIVQTAKPESEQIANSAASLDKALTSFQDEQLALGREMGVLLADGQDLAFNLPKVTNSIDIAGQSVSIPTTGAVSRASAATPAENGRNLFSLKVTADLSDVQQNITGILRSALNRSPRCGERIEIQQATLTPLAPASLVAARLHFERWVCPPGLTQRSPGRESPMEVVAGDGAIEVKLTPTVDQTADQKAGLGLASEITRVEAGGFLRNMLRSGDLGDTLREQIAASLLSALQKGTGLKTTLPAAAQESATLQKAQFQDAGADQLNLVLEGQLQFSDEQTQQFAAQLKQRLAAQGTPTP